MNKHVVSTLTGVVLVAAAFVSRADDDDQGQFPQITQQPVDSAVPIGGNAVFSAQATNGNLSFQWYKNGLRLEGKTGSTLVLENVGTNDVGMFTCSIGKAGGESVPTRTASLNVYTLLDGGPIVVYGAPVFSSGSHGTCPGAYAGYVNYIKTVAQGWGWAPTSGTTVHTAADGTIRTDTK